MRFIKVAGNEAWSKWLQLLRMMYDPVAAKDKGNIDGDDDHNLIDVDIFDDTEPNTFDETVYTCYKCFKFLLKHVNQSTIDQKEQILSKFSTLQNL